MFKLDNHSVHSDASSVGSSNSALTGSTATTYRPGRVCYGINTRAILEEQYETITNRYLSTSQFMKVSVECSLVTSALEKLKKSHSNGGNKLIYNLDNVQLTQSDHDLRSRKDATNGDEQQQTDDGTGLLDTEFERTYGTSIKCTPPVEPYIAFEAPSAETAAKLSKLLAVSKGKELAGKTTLTDDIEQQLAIRPLRVSKRQRKKANAEARAKTLGPGWFNMPRVTELTKEQERDLAALKMRNVWNAKSFYKKNSGMLETKADGPDSGTGKFFQIGTVVESKTDFYNDRLPRKQRKQTIVDELMNDQELLAFNKRKLKYAMSKNSRLRMMMMRAKQRKMKHRLKAKRDAKLNKYGDGKPRVNKFRTYDM